MRIAQDEIFGPSPVSFFEDEADATRPVKRHILWVEQLLWTENIGARTGWLRRSKRHVLRQQSKRRDLRQPFAARRRRTGREGGTWSLMFLEPKTCA